MVNNDTLTLCYTGNLVYRDGSLTSWQCLAREKPDGGFEKYGSALGLPEGYSADVSNPKVWQHRGRWSGEADNGLELSAGRLEVIIRLSGPLILNFSKQLIFSYDGHEIRPSRRSLVSGDWQHRYWQLNRAEVA